MTVILYGNKQITQMQQVTNSYLQAKPITVRCSF